MQSDSLTVGPLPQPPASPAAVRVQTLVGVGVLLVGLGLAFGAISIPSEAGYGGVGPNFLPWLVSIVLTICGGWIIWEARTGGFREMDAPADDAEPAYWSGFVWLSAGLLLNAALITVIGFILSCTLCYVLAVQGLRRAAGQAAVNQPRTWLIDLITGLLISAPVYWMFTKFLAINLPGLTTTGWL
ncbi:tripartite tricarboxylate transporter TctB family protein [Variovorax fucosicus]|uniref:tripartite tricarboxylate transporter TctB family protein n=1 Tax=Variovorax fucosicus TaxID=3053517 RepID=UPI002574BCC0|nr:tripartite tricarboxylate transporter TctB family protein [Variovorax sp. J22G47]MDM0057159.1 tripartite tricarboxylate transporter TctB family protein [Variovorax sp. J22G47]